MADAKNLLANKSLESYINALRRFDEAFCREMTGGGDFTIRLEVHGCKHRLIHCRVYIDGIDRPVEEKSRS